MALYVNLALLLLWGAVLLRPAPAGAALPAAWRARRKALFCTIATGQWVFLASCRSYIIGGDTRFYVEHYLRADAVPWREVGKAALRGFQKIDSVEPGYQALVKLVRLVGGGNYQVLFLVVALCFLVPLGIFIYRNSKMPLLSFVLFSCMLYGEFTFLALRQAIAVGVGVLLSYRFLRERRFVPFALLVLLGASFHKTCLLMLPLYFVLNLPWYKYSAPIAIAGAGLIYVVRFPLFDWAVHLTGYAGYGEYISGFGKTTMLMYFALAAVLWWRQRAIATEEPQQRFACNALLLALCITPLVTVHQSVIRVVDYLALLLLLAVPQIVASFRRKERALVYLTAIAALALLLARSKPGYLFFWQPLP